MVNLSASGQTTINLRHFDRLLKSATSPVSGPRLDAGVHGTRYEYELTLKGMYGVERSDVSQLLACVRQPTDPHALAGLYSDCGGQGRRLSASIRMTMDCGDHDLTT